MVIRHTDSLDSLQAKLVLGALLVCFLLASCKSSGAKPLADVPKYVPTKYVANIQSALNEAGDNAPELLKVLTTLKGEELEGASFLISTMPFPDLISIKADYLMEHIRYAYLIKHKYHWMKDMPEDIFLAYVLPYRMAEEPIMDHPVRSEQHTTNRPAQNDKTTTADASNGTSRKYFFEQLDPLVKECENMFEAAYQVNLWLGGQRADGSKRVGFKSSEGRDKTPFATLLGGQGRCEEMMIVFMAAARSIGIPARAVSTPYWAKCDNNHAWTEIWAVAPNEAGRWYPVGSCEPTIQNGMIATAGRAWFTETAATAAAIYTTQFGQPQDKSSIYQDGKKDTTINVLPNYSLTCKLGVTVLNQDGKAVSNTPVALSVVNWSTFRKVGVQKTDTNGKAAFTAGIGQYMLSAGSEKLMAWQIISTTPNTTLPIILTLSADNSPSGYFTLRFPDTHQAYLAFTSGAPQNKTTAKEEIPERIKKINAEHCPAAPPETYSFNDFQPAKHPEIMQLIDYSPLSAQIVSVLKLSGGNWVEMAGAIKEVPPEQKEDLLWLVSTLNLVDSLENTKDILLEHVKYAQLARQQLPIQISDDIYRSYVLSPRMPYLHIYQWRKELYDRFVPIADDASNSKILTIADMALRINEWIETHIKLVDAPGGRFFVSPNPADIIRSKRSPRGGPVMATVAALRSVGIPAQVKESWVEFYTGTEWLPLYPMDSKNLGKKTANEEVQQAYVKKGAIKIVTTKNGLPFSTNEPNCGLSSFSGGGWNDLREEFGTAAGLVSVAPGQYLLTASARNDNGDVLVYARPVTITSGQGIRLTIPLDMPLDMLSTHERVVRKLNPVPDFTLMDKDGQKYSLKQSLANDNVLLVFFTLESEPSIRMLPLIRAMKEKAKAAGVQIWTVLTDQNADMKEVLQYSSDLPVLLDKDMAVTKQFIPADVLAKKKEMMPSILLIKKDGKIMLWKEGYNLAVAEILEDAFNTLSGKEATATTLETLNKSIKMEEIGISELDYNKKALQYLVDGNYPKAIELYKKVIDSYPDDFGTWYDYACALSRNNSIDEAFAALKKAIELGYSSFDWMKEDPDLENLRRDKRFKELIP